MRKVVVVVVVVSFSCQLLWFWHSQIMTCLFCQVANEFQVPTFVGLVFGWWCYCLFV